MTNIIGRAIKFISNIPCLYIDNFFQKLGDYMCVLAMLADVFLTTIFFKKEYLSLGPWIKVRENSRNEIKLPRTYSLVS